MIDMTWDLSGLYRDAADPRIHEDMQTAYRRAKEFASQYKGRLRDLRKDPGAMLSVLREYEAIHEIGLRPYFYGTLLSASDTQDHRKSALMQRLRETWNDVALTTLFFPLEMRALDEGALKRLSAAPELTSYRRFIQRALAWKSHTLSEDQERLVEIKRLSGVKALVAYFDEFMGSLSFPVVVTGEERRLTKDEVLSCLHSSDRELRERAFTSLLDGLGDRGLTFKYIMNTLLLEKQLEDRERRHTDPMHRTHLQNDVDPGVIESMMSVVEDHYGLAQRFFRIKGRLLKIERLKNTDLFAPLDNEEIRVTYGEARDLVLEALASAHPVFLESAERIFKERRIDAESRPRKRGGGFCSCLSPSLDPFISMHFTGMLRDVLTLAHELGHAIHNRLSATQSYVNFTPPLVLAETASSFCEMLLVERLMERPSFAGARVALLASRIETVITTVFRQNVLTRFEQAIHRARKDHLLSAEEIGNHWWLENGRLFGDAVDMIGPYRWGWAYIPHFIYQPFYCYSYIFGYLVSVMMFEGYREEGAGFLDRVISLLEAGSSEAPLELLAHLGWDARHKGFWEEAFRHIARWIGVFEEQAEGLCHS